MLPDPLLRELRYVEIVTTRKMRTLRVGPSTSRWHGPGFDFDEHRPYRPGDDVRRIDWNVTARLRAPFVRATHAERELNVVVAIDLSRSMAFGTVGRTKKEAALVIAACLAFSAHGDQIGVGWLAFADRVLAYHAPGRRRARTWRLLGELWRLDPPPGDTALEEAIEYLARRLRTPGVVIVVSDFLTPNVPPVPRGLAHLAARHDVAAIVVEDPGEVDLAAARGTVTVRDLESRRRWPITLDRRSRRAYRALVERRRGELASSFYRAGVDWVVVSTEGNLIEPVLGLFARRRCA